MLSSLLQTNRRPEVKPGEETDSVHPRPRQLKLDNAFRPVGKRKNGLKASATLVVAPTALLSQWGKELERSSKPGTFKITVWHGQNRLDLGSTMDIDDDKPDKPLVVIVTSYGVLMSEHAKLSSPLFESRCL